MMEPLLQPRLCKVYQDFEMAFAESRQSLGPFCRINILWKRFLLSEREQKLYGGYL